MAILWLFDMLHSFPQMRCYLLCLRFFHVSDSTCYRFPLTFVIFSNLSLLTQFKNKLFSLSQQVKDYLFTFLPNCLAQLVVVFVALQRYVANRGVAECPLVNK